MQVFMQPLENLTQYQEIRERLPKNRGVLGFLRAAKKTAGRKRQTVSS